MQTKKALGKGLGALIHTPYRKPDASAPAALDTGETVRRIAVDSLVPSPLQPRKHIREDQLDELVDSIREYGVIQPLIVRDVEGHFEIIAGERRWRACAGSIFVTCL